MKTSVTYSVVARKNPHEPESPALYYAHAQARGEADIRTLSNRIELMCTVTRADVMAVLVALESTISECLANGEIVRLGDLGSLQVSLSSKGSFTKDEFVPTLIYKNRILFRPGLTLQNMQKTVTYERVEQKPKGKTPAAPEPGTGGGSSDGGGDMGQVIP